MSVTPTLQHTATYMVLLDKEDAYVRHAHAEDGVKDKDKETPETRDGEQESRCES